MGGQDKNNIGYPIKRQSNNETSHFIGRQNNSHILDFNAIKDTGHDNYFSPAQYNQLCHLFQDIKNEQQGNQYSNAIAFANCACIVTLYFTHFPYSFLSKIDSSSWILDSGASEHMT